MPNAALIALTSPILMGEVPEGALENVQPSMMETSAVVELSIEPAATSKRLGLLSLQWSLASAQSVDPTQSDQPNEDENPQQSTQEESSEEVGDNSNVIIVTGTYGPPAGDPIARINEESYRITQRLDNVFVEPVAYAYRDGLPGPLRDGLSNFVQNLGEPNNALNFLLQGKFGKAFETLGRLLINSTLGVGGLFDIAQKPGIGLPHRRNGFGNTLGYYGVGSGPYLYLPVTGATTVRDVIGSGLDQLLLPTAVGKPFNQLEFTVPFYIVSNLDARLDFDAELARIDDTIDPYAARRDSYLYRRAKTIAELKGEEPPEPPAIMEEVEGTGDFAEEPEEEASEATNNPPPAPDTNAQPDERAQARANAVIITRPR